jgi:hypothetical protein
MALQLVDYVRKPFRVKAVEVTEDNFNEVAQWCNGEILVAGEEDGTKSGQQFIKVQVKRPLSERQTRAYVGDWVLSALQGPASFKVYTPKAFEDSFDKVVAHMFETVQRMEDRIEREETLEKQDETLDLEFIDPDLRPALRPSR